MFQFASPGQEPSSLHLPLCMQRQLSIKAALLRYESVQPRHIAECQPRLPPLKRLARGQSRWGRHAGWRRPPSSSCQIFAGIAAVHPHMRKSASQYQWCLLHRGASCCKPCHYCKQQSSGCETGAVPPGK